MARIKQEHILIQKVKCILKATKIKQSLQLTNDSFTYSYKFQKQLNTLSLNFNTKFESVLILSMQNKNNLIVLKSNLPYYIDRKKKIPFIKICKNHHEQSQKEQKLNNSHRNLASQHQRVLSCQNNKIASDMRTKLNELTKLTQYKRYRQYCQKKNNATVQRQLNKNKIQCSIENLQKNKKILYQKYKHKCLKIKCSQCQQLKDQIAKIQRNKDFKIKLLKISTSNNTSKDKVKQQLQLQDLSAPKQQISCLSSISDSQAFVKNQLSQKIQPQQQRKEYFFSNTTSPEKKKQHLHFKKYKKQKFAKTLIQKYEQQHKNEDSFLRTTDNQKIILKNAEFLSQPFSSKLNLKSSKQIQGSNKNNEKKQNSKNQFERQKKKSGKQRFQRISMIKNLQKKENVVYQKVKKQKNQKTQKTFVPPFKAKLFNANNTKVVRFILSILSSQSQSQVSNKQNETKNQEDKRIINQENDENQEYKFQTLQLFSNYLPKSFRKQARNNEQNIQTNLRGQSICKQQDSIQQNTNLQQTKISYKTIMKNKALKIKSQKKTITSIMNAKEIIDEAKLQINSRNYCHNCVIVDFKRQQQQKAQSSQKIISTNDWFSNFQSGILPTKSKQLENSTFIIESNIQYRNIKNPRFNDFYYIEEQKKQIDPNFGQKTYIQSDEVNLTQL